MTSGHACFCFCFFTPRGGARFCFDLWWRKDEFILLYWRLELRTRAGQCGVVGGCGAPLHGHRATMEFPPELRRFEKVPKTTHVIDSCVDPLKR